MKITHVITTFEPGGAEFFLYDLLVGLPKKWTQQVVFLKGSGSLKEEPKLKDIPVAKVSIESLTDLLRAPFKLKNLLKDSDIVHSHLLKANALTSIATHEHKHVGTRHNDEKILENHFIRLAHRLLSRRENKHVAISSAVKNFYINHGLKENDFLTIPYGFDVPSTPPVPIDITHEFGIPPDSPCLLTAGRLVPQKNQQTLIEALKNWPEAHLIICGIGPLEKELKTLTQQLQMKERIHFAGFQKDLSRFIVSSDLFVFPSLWEGFGRVLFEAMAHGCPVAASECSAIPEVLGGTAWYFDPQNSKDLLTTIQKAWQSKDEWEVRKNQMHERLKTHFSKDAMITAHENLYRAMVSN